MDKVFPEFKYPELWLPKYEKWLKAKSCLMSCYELKSRSEEEHDEQLELTIEKLIAEMANNSPPERWLWKDGFPVLDKWAVMAEQKQKEE